MFIINGNRKILGPFKQMIQEQMANRIHNTSSINYSSADEIEKYKELFDIGVITQEEYDTKKKELLGL